MVPVVASNAECAYYAAGRGERTVAVDAVGGFLARCGRKCDQGVARRHLDTREAAAEIGAALVRDHGLPQMVGQGVVAAGIEENQVDRRLSFHQPYDRLELDRLGGDEKFAIQPRAGRDQIILLADLQRMASVEQQASAPSSSRTNLSRSSAKPR